ncbi:MAG: ABC transporter substrate-binding protein [Clostridiaceae bacterium]
MKKSKKIISLLLTSLMVMSLAACGSSKDASDGGKDETKKLTIWAWDPNFNIPVMEEAKKIYTEANPGIEIEVVEMAKADVEQKLQTNLASGVTDGLPDIVLVEDYNSQKYLQAFPGSFTDLTNSINYDNFADYKVQLMTLDEKVYGVPFDSGVSGFFYRTDILEEAGYSADDVKDITWDQFIEIGKKVKEKTGKYLLSFDAADGGLMRVMLQSAGAWYFNEDGSVNLANNDTLIEAVESYKKVVDADIAKPTSGWTEWVSAFNTGDVASVTSGIWIIGSIKAETSQSGKWMVAPTPRLNDSKSVNASNLGGSSWYVLDSSKNKDTAIDFLNTIYAGDNDFYQTILTNQGAVGSYTPAQSGSAYSSEDEFFGGQKVFAEMSSWMNDIPAVNYGTYTYEADSAIMAVVPDVLSGSKTAKEALADAETQLKAQIGE